MFTTSNNTERKELTNADIEEMFADLTKDVEKRKGFIVMPSINGFDFYEIEEDRLKQFLLIEGRTKQLEKEGKSTEIFEFNSEPKINMKIEEPNFPPCFGRF